MRRACLRLFDNGTYVSSSSICVTLSYVPYLPFTKRAALRCTISNLSELYFWWGCQTVALYSRKDHTRLIGTHYIGVILSLESCQLSIRIRSKRFPLVFPDIPSGCASRMTTWSLLSW